MIFDKNSKHSFKLKKSKCLKFEIVFWTTVVFAFIIIYLIYMDRVNTYKLEKQRTLVAVYCLENIYNNGNVSNETTLNDVDKCLKKIKEVNDYNISTKLKTDIQKTKNYIILREEVDSYFNLDVVESDISIEEINFLESKLNNMVDVNKEELASKIENMRLQIQKINNLETLVNNLYETEEKKDLRKDLTREDYNKCVEAYEQVIQQNVRDRNKQYIDKADQYLKEQEEKIRIQNAWITLDVPYISQNKAGVNNGCEAASLLMGLKYKGYLKDMNLVTYSTNMPKSNDPNLGFYLSIFSLEPKSEAHWIAPAPLAQYGRSSSGNNNVIDATGWSLDQITNEVINENPVVVYLTYDFKKPRSWSKGAPQNLHVQLLTGYNTITKKYVITDPWTRWSGKYEFILNKSDLEHVYNGVGKKAVVVR